MSFSAPLHTIISFNEKTSSFSGEKKILLNMKGRIKRRRNFFFIVSIIGKSMLKGNENHGKREMKEWEIQTFAHCDFLLSSLLCYFHRDGKSCANKSDRKRNRKWIEDLCLLMWDIRI